MPQFDPLFLSDLVKGSVGGPDQIGQDRAQRALGFAIGSERQNILAPQFAQMGITPSGRFGEASRFDFSQSFPQQQIDLQQRQFEQQQLNRRQILELLGLLPQTQGFGAGSPVGSTGLLGTPLVGSVLQNTLPDVVGGVTGAIPGLGGALGQPGFPDAPGGGGGGAPASSLFGQLLQGRGALGSQILEQLAGFGGSERARIQREQELLQNNSLAQLAAHGLAGSNIATGEIERASRFGAEQRGALEDRLISQRVGALQQIGEGLFGDVGSELDRQVTSRGQQLDFLSSLLGDTLNLI